MQVNSYKGYSLFRDVESRPLRIANQGVTLANIYEDNCKGNVISKQGAISVLGYMNQVQPEDRLEVKEHFEVIMQERGFLAVGV